MINQGKKEVAKINIKNEKQDTLQIRQRQKVPLNT